MQELTQEQIDFLVRINTPEYRAEALKADLLAMEAARAARAESDRLWAAQRARWEELERQREEAIRPLKEALKAAGIKLHLASYEGVWGQYQIGNGPVVYIDDDSFDTDEED